MVWGAAVDVTPRCVVFCNSPPLRRHIGCKGYVGIIAFALRTLALLTAFSPSSIEANRCDFGMGGEVQ